MEIDARPESEPTATSAAPLEHQPTTTIPAGFWIRFVAYVIDSIIICLILTPVQMLGAYLTQPSTPNQMAAPNFGAFMAIMSLIFLVQIVVVGSYAGYFYAKKGGTPGKLLFKMQVKDAETGLNCSFWQGALRDTVGKTVSYIIFFIGYIMAGFSPEKKALHDRLFNTLVIRKV